MTAISTLIDRNAAFAARFTMADLPILPKLRAVVLTCGDARVDPAHVLGLELGEAVVIRNNGGRITPEVVKEIAALAFLAARLDGPDCRPFELIVMQHTQCGAERFADPDLQRTLMEQIGVDVSSVAISDHETSLRDDIETLRQAPEVPGYIVASGLLYDTAHGHVREIVAPAPLAQPSS